MFWKFLVFSYLISEVAPWHVVHNKIEIGSVLKGIDHIDEEGVFELT